LDPQTVAIAAGIVLPHLARRDVRLLAPSDEEDEDAALARLRDTVGGWQAEAARKGKPLRLPIMPFLLRNIWMGAMLLFSLITASTFFITQVWQVGSHLIHLANTGRLSSRPLWLSA
jgi:solute carrier family 45 protein 1/2/4